MNNINVVAALWWRNVNEGNNTTQKMTEKDRKKVPPSIYHHQKIWLLNNLTTDFGSRKGWSVFFLKKTKAPREGAAVMTVNFFLFFLEVCQHCSFKFCHLRGVPQNEINRLASYVELKVGVVCVMKMTLLTWLNHRGNLCWMHNLVSV